MMNTKLRRPNSGGFASLLLSAAFTVVSPGLLPYQAAAQVMAARAVVPVRAAPVVPARASLPGAVPSLTELPEPASPFLIKGLSAVSSLPTPRLTLPSSAKAAAATAVRPAETTEMYIAPTAHPRMANSDVHTRLSGIRSEMPPHLEALTIGDGGAALSAGARKVFSALAGRSSERGSGAFSLERLTRFFDGGRRDQRRAAAFEEASARAGVEFPAAAATRVEDVWREMTRLRAPTAFKLAGSEGRFFGDLESMRGHDAYAEVWRAVVDAGAARPLGRRMPSGVFQSLEALGTSEIVAVSDGGLQTKARIVTGRDWGQGPLLVLFEPGSFIDMAAVLIPGPRYSDALRDLFSDAREIGIMEAVRKATGERRGVSALEFSHDKVGFFEGSFHKSGRLLGRTQGSLKTLAAVWTARFREAFPPPAARTLGDLLRTAAFLFAGIGVGLAGWLAGSSALPLLAAGVLSGGLRRVRPLVRITTSNKHYDEMALSRLTAIEEGNLKPGRAASQRSLLVKFYVSDKGRAVAYLRKHGLVAQTESYGTGGGYLVELTTRSAAEAARLAAALVRDGLPYEVAAHPSVAGRARRILAGSLGDNSGG